jgi:HEAT repeat protein
MIVRVHFLSTDLRAALRTKAIYALGDLGPAAKSVLPALLHAAANDPDWVNRGGAVETLGAIGPDAKEAIPLLLEISKSEDAWMRRAAQKVLSQIAPDAPAVGGHP